MAHTAEITFKEFRRRYSSEAACSAELFRLRFPDGFVCPKCGCVEYYPIHGRNTFQCRSCRHQTSVTAGTVMHRTRLPLTLWFWAIYLCATDKRGISAIQLSHTLGICYDSAWHLLDRIRTAMGQRDEKYLLSGIVELDDGYVGGPSHNGKRGRGTDKAKIVVAVSKAENGVPLFARMKAVENVQGKTLQEIIDQYFAPNTKVECDGYRSYLNLEGVKLIVGDKCLGMLEAVGEVFPEAKYQRCVVHFYRNVFSVVPKSKVKNVAKMLKAIHAQESKKAAREKAAAVAAELKAMKLPEAAKKVADGIEETLTYCDFPSEHWVKIRTNNVIERMNREIRRRTRVVGAFPDGNSALMLVCARLRHVAGTQWGSKKYMNMKHLEAMEQEPQVG